MQFSRASTPPIQAKVRSTISQFLKHLFPNLSLSKSSTISITYEEIGFDESRPVSVPKYILPISLGFILFAVIN